MVCNVVSICQLDATLLASLQSHRKSVNILDQYSAGNLILHQSKFGDIVRRSRREGGTNRSANTFAELLYLVAPSRNDVTTKESCLYQIPEY